RLTCLPRSAVFGRSASAWKGWTYELALLGQDRSPAATRSAILEDAVYAHLANSVRSYYRRHPRCRAVWLCALSQEHLSKLPCRRGRGPLPQRAKLRGRAETACLRIWLQDGGHVPLFGEPGQPASRSGRGGILQARADQPLPHPL